MLSQNHKKSESNIKSNGTEPTPEKTERKQKNNSYNPKM